MADVKKFTLKRNISLRNRADRFRVQGPRHVFEDPSDAPSVLAPGSEVLCAKGAYGWREWTWIPNEIMTVAGG
jgi:hypothetical protein